MACTSQEFDELLEKMEAALPALGGNGETDAGYSVKRMIAQHDLLQPFAEASNHMRAALIDTEDIQQDRVKLIALFGGDCARISRLRCICEDADKEVASERPEDRRVVQCLASCDSVERVLEDCGFGAQLRAARQRQQDLLLRRRSTMQKKGLTQESIENLQDYEAALPRRLSSASALSDNSDIDESPEIVEPGRLEPSHAEPTSDIETNRTVAELQSEDHPRRHPLDPLRSEGYVISQGAPLSSPLSSDPLRRLANDAKLAENPLTGGKKAEKLEAFLGEKITPVPVGVSRPPSAANSPRQKAETKAEKAAAPGVEMVSSEDKNGVTWYKMRLVEYGIAKFVWKRYSDFVKLDESLANAKKIQIGLGKEFRLVLGDIPDPGLFGFRHAIGVASFEKQRQQALQEYITKLLSQVDSLSEYPDIKQFFTVGIDHPFLRSE